MRYPLKKRDIPMKPNSLFFRIILLILTYFIYLFAWNKAFAEEKNLNQQIISLKGYLGKEELKNIKINEESKTLILEVNSSSGDLNQVLDIAKKIYELKQEKNIYLIVYIEDNALGPAAIFPLLADELYISLFVSWGDIPLGNENVMPINILRNRVLSLILPSQPHVELLRLIAEAMTDPSVQIAEDKEWKILKNVKEGENLQTISPKGETLVINQQQLQKLGLVKEVVNIQKFRSMFKYPETKPNQIIAPNVMSPTLEGMPIPINLLDEELRKYIKYNPDGPNVIGHMIIDDRTSGINESTWLYVKKALDYFKTIKPIFVILELNTPGGEVFSAQKISDALKELDTQYNIPVVCYINNWAISAGAMLAYSCRFIVGVKDATMGAAEPVLMDTSGKMEAASEKVNSALRADFANRAAFFDRNPYIAEAMVDKDIILVQRHGRIYKLDSESQIKTSGPDPDVIISPKGKLLTLNSEQLLNYGIADIILPPAKTDLITDVEKEEGKWPASKMLLFQQPFFKGIPNATIDSYRMDWKTIFFVFLANPIVSSMLFLGLIVGLYLEINTPGFGFAGTLAATCLFLIILSSFSLELANWLELILLLVGLAIILIELFVLPTFGLLGFIGIIFFLIGLFGMMLPGIGNISFELDTHTWNAAGEAFFKRLGWLSGTLVLAFIIILFLARYVTPSLAGFSRFVLTGNEQSGYIAGDNPEELPQPGASGEAITTLRPAGKILVNDKIYDAITPGNFIEKGTSIIVIDLDGSVIVVNKLGGGHE